ncbi:hypothetical protein ACFZBU_45345 [Embleya sp. NPDC008237]|uniref:hypothetical protein n=1 Tax=Embleya sp. NPDC008237 TaxID=3363978 RepID=UPI0036F02D74
MNVSRTISAAGLSLMVATGLAVVPTAASATPTSAAAAACGGGASAGALGNYGAASYSSCTRYGSPGSRVTYTFYSKAKATVCAQGWGYNSSNQGQWYTLGCVDPGRTAIVTAPWGNNAARPRLRATTTAAATPGVTWSH